MPELDDIGLADVGLDEEVPTDPRERVAHWEVKMKMLSALVLFAAEKRFPGIEEATTKAIKAHAEAMADAARAVA